MLAAASAAKILDGRRVAKILIEEVKRDFARLKGNDVPRLDILKCNDEPASAAYIRHKCKAMQDLGFECKVHDIRTVKQLFETARSLNEDPAVHGIVTQLPVKLDTSIDNSMVYPLIRPWKDVDGLNPVNMGLLAMSEASPYFYPCTAEAVMQLIDSYGIQPVGKRVCIVGRSAIVGRPLFHMFMRRDATVTLCHSLTPDLPSIIKEADIVIVAIGKAKFIQADWIKPGAIVIDVGINEVGNTAGKRVLVGDVDFEGVERVAGAITPVPGGVGPLTVAMLMKNVLKAYELNTIEMRQQSI